MLGILYLLLFLAGGVLIARFWLPRRRAVVRWYLGAALGVLLTMWLPALWAYAVRFSLLAHGLAAGTLCLLVLGAYFTRDGASPLPFSQQDQKNIKLLLFTALPLTLLAGYLEYTHSIRPAPDGYYVGQSTYGDLSLHLAVTTSAVNAPFPLPNSLMIGATMAYPYLSDTIATSMYMLGMGLPLAMSSTGTLLCLMTFAGFTLLAAELCRKRGAAALAVLLLFFNGGLGFFYTLSGTVQDGASTTMWDNLRTIITGYYKTPTNQPDPYNLRWVNIICDMLVPQRGFLGGWSMLMPVFLLILPPLKESKRPETRAMLAAGIIAGGMPLLHTHSFLALGLASIGFCGYAVIEAPKGERLNAFKPFLWYGGVALLLALPQLISLTFVQAISSDHFLRFQFNWCNNRGGGGLVEPYFWFYIKNIGLPYLLILLALFQRKRSGSGPEDLRYNAAVRQYRLIAAGAFLILLIAEFIIFQPNEYDNNKLIYVWFLLCLPMAADYAMTLYEKIKGVGGRRIIAALFLITCFLSAGLTVARECVSNYQAYTNEDLAAAEFINGEIPEHSVFITGTQHLNPVASLAGRTIVNGSDLYLYFHGFNTTKRKQELAAFYRDPADHLDLLAGYGVDYVYVSVWERSAYTVNEEELDMLFERIYESETGNTVIWFCGGTDEGGSQ